MARAAVIRRIESLTEDEFDRVVPYLEADLDAARAGLLEGDTADLLRAVENGRTSARTEPLLDNDAVFAMARARSARP
jgi:hypothetical protein